MMPEKAPTPESPLPLEPDVDQLADWIINHETSSDQTSTPDPEKPTQNNEVPESYFERRKEAPDLSALAPQPSPVLKPMTPISQVLKSNPLLPSQPTQAQETAARKRLLSISSSLGTKYATAVLQGFGAALVIIVLILVILLTKALT